MTNLLDAVPYAYRRTCTHCHCWVDSRSPYTFKLVQGWRRWKVHGSIAFMEDLDTYLCQDCHDELARPSLVNKQPRLFHIASDGAIDPYPSGECQDCGLALWATHEHTYLLLRGWLQCAYKRTNTTSQGSRQNSIAYVTVMGRMMCSECVKRKKLGIPVGQQTLWDNE